LEETIMGHRTPENLIIRNYHGEEDISAIVALYNEAAMVDDPELGRTEDEMRLTMSAPRRLPEENAFLSEVNGQLVAYGSTWLEEGPEQSVFELCGIVHPAWRRQGIGTRLMERLEQRVEERLGEAKVQAVHIVTDTNLKFEDRQALFRKMGYERVRYFFDMERPLWENGTRLDLPAPLYPEGIVVRTMAERPDLHAVWETCDEAFRDHWGYTESILEEWQHWTEEDPHYLPERWLIAWDAEKDVAAGVCLNGVEPENNKRVGRKEGWVFVLAVRRPYRKKGLGRALLLDGITILQQEGMEWAMLGVDTENLTGALRLYRGVGFRPVRTYAAFRKTVRL
jgi:mycothiol synthase